MDIRRYKMVAVNALSSINTNIYINVNPILSDATMRKLKELGINTSGITSEEEAKKLIDKQTAAKEQTNKTSETDERFDKIYQRLKTLSMHLGVSMSQTEKIETVLSKIQARIALFSQYNNSNINAARSEYDSIKYTYETLTSSKSNLFTGLDILGKTNKVLVGMRK